MIQRKPPWIRSVALRGEAAFVSERLRQTSLNTVCEAALCPNRGTCWSSGTATFMLMGSVCTRNCLFCSVRSAERGEPLSRDEPLRLARAVRAMSLRYVVLTSVDRDDLLDFGAGHFAACIRAVKAFNPGVRVEALIPDFQGDSDCLRVVLDAGPDVVAHNIEVVERLQSLVRDARASYEQSLSVLCNVKSFSPRTFTKSGLMLGLGETKREVFEAMDDLLGVGCDFLTLGQYLQPTKWNLPVKEFVHPKMFAEYKRVGLKKGFKHIESGPLVRSSFGAGDVFEGQSRL